jgi:hypothetical protein
LRRLSEQHYQDFLAYRKKQQSSVFTHLRRENLLATGY